MTNEGPQGIPHDVIGQLDEGMESSDAHAAAGDVASAIAEQRRMIALLDGCERTHDVLFIRARLFLVLGGLEYGIGNLAESIEAYRSALEGVDATVDATMGPNGRPLWLETAVRVLIHYADALHKVSDMTTAHALLDRADTLLLELDDPVSATLLVDIRASLYIASGDWARAEALLLASLPDADADLRGRLHTSLGTVYAITGRLDDAADEYQRASDAYETSSWPVPHGELTVDLADLAHRRGDLDTAIRLYQEAVAEFTQIGREGDVAVCLLSLAEIAVGSEDDAADELLSESLRRFTALGMSAPAADAMLLTARRAFERADFRAAEHYLRSARSTYDSLGSRERCAQADYLMAQAIEAVLNAGLFQGPEREAIDNAIAMALPAALYIESIRYDFPSSAARAHWLSISTAAMNLSFRLAIRRKDTGLFFELVEFRCAGAPLALAPPVEPPSIDRLPEPLAGNDDDSAHTLGRAVGDVASAAGLRVAPPPGIIMSPGLKRIALSEYVDVAQRRYRADIVGQDRIPSW